ncbi:Ca2-binding protein [Aureococcus anophagefferens]|nr:Ca2-binding protein [Aureococcus anophagefferens]
MRPIVESLFSELTLLGFIGLTLFLVFKMAWLKELSEKLYGEENEITELGEAVHMVLFLIMVIFLAQAVLMAQMGERILSTWKTWEQRKIESFAQGHRVDPRYQCKFWYGETHKAHFTLDILRTIPLGMAIYIAVLLLVYLPQLFEDQVFKPFPFLFRLAWVFVALGPPMVCQYKLPRIVQDFAVVANVESLQNLRNVEQVIRRQKTEAAFDALKVVSFLRKPDAVARVLEGDGAATMTRHEHAMAQSRTNEDEHARRERIEIARAEDDRQERSWRAIFNVFDNDHEGSIDHDEMKALLSKFSDDSSPAGSEQIDKIIKLLDDDGSGEISFDEFFVFGRALERHVATSVDPAELIQDMFDIIDEDRGGLITVQELHQTISEIGQELSVDDVYNLIKDIDDDGNGALDIHEFHLLLNRRLPVRAPRRRTTAATATATTATATTATATTATATTATATTAATAARHDHGRRPGAGRAPQGRRPAEPRRRARARRRRRAARALPTT